MTISEDSKNKTAELGDDIIQFQLTHIKFMRSAFFVVEIF